MLEEASSSMLKISSKHISFLRTLFCDKFSAYWLSPSASWKQWGRCVGVIGVDCVLLSMEESGWKNCTDVLDVAVVKDVDLFMDSFCISNCGEADWIRN